MATSHKGGPVLTAPHRAEVPARLRTPYEALKIASYGAEPQLSPKTPAGAPGPESKGAISPPKTPGSY